MKLNTTYSRALPDKLIANVNTQQILHFLLVLKIFCEELCYRWKNRNACLASLPVGTKWNFLIHRPNNVAESSYYA